MKKKIFNILVYTMLTYSIVTSIYLALPIEYQEMIPYVGQAMGIYTAILTAVGGTGGLAIQAFISKAQTTADEKSKIVTDQFFVIVDEYKAMKTEYEETKESLNETKAELSALKELIKVQLSTKLDNPMLTDTSRELIENTINTDEEVVTNEEEKKSL